MAAASKTVKKPEVDSMNIRSMAKGIAISYIITLPVFIIFSIILCFVDFPANLITPVVILTTIVSLLCSGYISSKGLKSRGWLNGAITGLIYISVLYLVGSTVLSNFRIDRYVAITVVIAVLSGVIGGMAGMNSGRRPRRKKTPFQHHSRVL